MLQTHSNRWCSTAVFLSLISCAVASETLRADQSHQINQTDGSGAADQARLQHVAALLADYERQAQHLTDKLGERDLVRIAHHANQLIMLSESIIAQARLRLPQCDAYLHQTLALKARLHDMEHETMERDYHHDGALPKASSACYHVKDLLVHPASVLLLLRDDPQLQQQTLASIHAEIAEVLGHTEAVRQVIMY